MQTHADKKPLSRNGMRKPGEGAFQFNDQRPETAAHNRRQAIANASPQAAQARAIQAKADTAPRANDTGLPDNLKAGIESLSGISMDSVRVHYNSGKPGLFRSAAPSPRTTI